MVGRPAPVITAALALLALAAAAGCKSIVTREPGTEWQAADVYAVTVADSVAPGASLTVTLHTRAACCTQFAPLVFRAIGDSTFELRPEVQLPIPPCLCPVGSRDVAVQLDHPPARTFYVRVYSANHVFTLAVVGGASPAPIERYRIEATFAGGEPMAGARVRLSSVAPDPGLVIEQTTGPDGVAEIALPCASTGARPYGVDITAPGDPYPTIAFGSTARCGVPERTRVSLLESF